MKKQVMHLLITGALMGILAALGGCRTKPADSAGAVTAENLTDYNGGGMKFSYASDRWRLSSAERTYEGAIISLTNQENEALVSMIAYERGDTTETQLFNYIREWDAEAGIRDEKTDRESTAGLKRRSLSYWVADEDAEDGRRYVYAEVFRYKDDETIAVLANYYHEEDLTEIKELLTTLDASNRSKVEDVLGTLEKEQHLGEVLDDFLYYYSGEYEKVWEEQLKSVDSSFHAKAGYEYIFDTEIIGYRGNAYPLMAPEDDYYEGSYFSYYDHGMYLYMNVTELDRNRDTITEYLKQQVAVEMKEYQDNPRDYSNLREEPMVVKDDYAYQVIRVTEIYADSQENEVSQVFYVKKLEDDEILCWSLELDDSYTDLKTYPITQELLTAYEIPTSVLTMEQPALTIGGNMVEKGQDIYAPYGEEEKVGKVADYPLIGKSLLDEYGVEAEVYVPRGKYTYHYGYYISFKMFGLVGETELCNNYQDYTTGEYAADQLSYTYQYNKEYTNYYRNLSELKTVEDLPDGMAAAYFSNYSVNTDNSESLVYYIVICRELEDGIVLATELELDTGNASKETVDLLAQYGEVLGIDLYQLMEAEEENPLTLLTQEL